MVRVTSVADNLLPSANTFHKPASDLVQLDNFVRTAPLKVDVRNKIDLPSINDTSIDLNLNEISDIRKVEVQNQVDNLSKELGIPGNSIFEKRKAFYDLMLSDPKYLVWRLQYAKSVKTLANAKDIYTNLRRNFVVLEELAGVKNTIYRADNELYEGMSKLFSKVGGTSPGPEQNKLAAEMASSLPTPTTVNPQKAMDASQEGIVALRAKQFNDAQYASILSRASGGDSLQATLAKANKVQASLIDQAERNSQMLKAMSKLRDQLRQLNKVKLNIAKADAQKAADNVRGRGKQVGGEVGESADGVANDVDSAMNDLAPPLPSQGPAKPDLPTSQLESAQKSVDSAKQKNKKMLAELDDEWDNIPVEDSTYLRRNANRAVMDGQIATDEGWSTVEFVSDPDAVDLRTAATVGEARMMDADTGLSFVKQMADQGQPDANVVKSVDGLKDNVYDFDRAMNEWNASVRNGTPDDSALAKAQKAADDADETFLRKPTGDKGIDLGGKMTVNDMQTASIVGGETNPQRALVVLGEASEEAVADLRQVVTLRVGVLSKDGIQAIEGVARTAEEAQAILDEFIDEMHPRLRMETKGQLDEGVSALIAKADSAYEEIGGNLAAAHGVNRVVNIMIDARSVSGNMATDPRRMDVNTLALENAKGQAMGQLLITDGQKLAKASSNHTDQGRQIAKNGKDGADGLAGSPGANGVDGKPLSKRKRNVIIGILAALGITATALSIWGIVYAIEEEERKKNEKLSAAERIERALRRFFYAAINGDIAYIDVIYAMEELLSEAKFLGIEMAPIWEERIDYLKSLMSKIDKNYNKYSSGELNMYEHLYGNEKSTSFWSRNWGWILLISLIIIGFILIGVIMYFASKGESTTPITQAPNQDLSSIVFF